MKQVRLLLFSMLLIPCIPTIAQTQDKLSTQDEETKAAIKEYKMVESELNQVFSKVLTVYKADVEFIKNIKESQDLWVKFRAAELKAKFPEGRAYGSVYTMCVNDLLTAMTNERITTLKLWLKGTYQGDVCSGSVRINE
jgi:uncharacterized protein YecT (DUF1311 family)